MRYRTPGVAIERTDAARAAPVVLRTDIAAFIGLAQRGPLDTPVPVESWRQFQGHFGDLMGGGYLAYAVRGFFDNGGRRCWVVRVAARRCDADAADGAAAAAVLLRDSAGTPVWRVAASSPGSWGNALTVQLERERPLTRPARTCDATSATLDSVAGFAVGELLHLEQAGSSALRVLVKVEAQARRLYWVHPDPRERRADQRAWSALDPARPLTLARVAYALTVRRRGGYLARYTDLHPASGHPRFIGLVLAPAYPDAQGLLRAPPPRGDDPLPAPPGAVTVAVLGAEPALIAPQDAAFGTTGGLTGTLTGGRDGLAALRADDFLGSPWSDTDGDRARMTKARGLQALAGIDEIALIACPDCLIQPRPDPDYEPPRLVPPNPCVSCPPPAPPARLHQPRPGTELPPPLPESEVLRVQSALIADCEGRGDRFAILSAPLARVADRARGVRAITQWRTLLTETQPARAAALYAPWIAVAESDDLPPPVPGSTAGVRLIPACGHVTGVIARTDLAFGVMRAPANCALRGLVDLRAALDDAQHGELNLAGVAALRAQCGREPMIQGARTLSDDPDWRYINVVRVVLTLRRAFEIALRWALFEPNDAATRAAVASTLIAILTLFWQRGAFAGGTMAESFYVRCDEVTTDTDARDRGELIALVGIAPAAPAEFIVLRVGRQDNLPLVTLFEGAFTGTGVAP